MRHCGDTSDTYVAVARGSCMSGIGHSPVVIRPFFPSPRPAKPQTSVLMALGLLQTCRSGEPPQVIKLRYRTVTSDLWLEPHRGSGSRPWGYTPGLWGRMLGLQIQLYHPLSKC